MNTCPRCGGTLLIAANAATTPTYPTCSDVPSVTEYRCQGCAERWVRDGAGVARTIDALAQARHWLARATSGREWAAREVEVARLRADKERLLRELKAADLELADICLHTGWGPAGGEPC